MSQLNDLGTLPDLACVGAFQYLDGDGDIDLTSADTRSFVLYWHENDGKGSFKQHIIEKNYPERLERHEIADLNRDGKPDVVIIENKINFSHCEIALEEPFVDCAELTNAQ